MYYIQSAEIALPCVARVAINHVEFEIIIADLIFPSVIH